MDDGRRPNACGDAFDGHGYSVNGRRIAVTGAGGRVGSALVAELRRGGANVVEWLRPDYDLDVPATAELVLARDRPDLVFHAAAWTDVDACAGDPELAMSRNGTATAELAEACAAAGVDLVFMSTNEVFSGDRTDGHGYVEDDPTDPPNAYGRSKLDGEEAVLAAYRGGAARAWTVRTSWIFGPPGNDFPERITAAADRSAGDPLRVVGNEMGRPTYAPDLAAALVRLIETTPPDTYHLANDGATSRFDWARVVLRRCRPEVDLEPIRLDDYTRASRPPRWGVVDTSRAAALGISLRPWNAPLALYLDEICADR